MKKTRLSSRARRRAAARQYLEHLRKFPRTKLTNEEFHAFRAVSDDILLSLMLAGVAGFAFTKISGPFVRFAEPIVKDPANQSVLFCTTLAVAIALYFLRKFLRYWYGVLEVGFATAVTFSAVGDLVTQGLSRWAVLGSAVYVLIRGLDNCAVGVQLRQANLDRRAALSRVEAEKSRFLDP